ncbi:hypothetical protein LTR35_014789 [Friedmanniomyces endolithicus]|uniref:HAUS augmin-like complex subunit 1 n=1 Tax=Friedmanniomyces endolithicus TaxID=329885 RepID=A0AAN6FE13_9PEZI|nr:hypothetical protein LTR35_014789 [Friedmanniomyces endolithicus]KAK0279238.1 hypothetical protein LTS00_013511 [Friedmanniomyces endolithicus]KAK0311689.1 hypothetical protein LTR82_014218 [Friedmanniomyces endolithicus]KAK0984530.1 hypothetical protein LTR54_014028 [Friedmanniomyces endolithicus]
MDSPGDWTATALFSPSKARAQQAQARDWASVESWLSKQHGKRIPSFERNEETLQALLTLATLNEDADEQRVLVEKVEKSALSVATTRNHDGEDVYQTLLDSLSQEDLETLDAVAGASVMLNASDFTQTCQRICELTADQFDLSQQLNRTECQNATIESECSRLKGLLTELRAFQPPPNVLEQTAEWTRSTKQLKSKLAEYDERLGAIRSVPTPSPSIEDVSRLKNEVTVLQNRLNMVTTELAAFDSLPSDPKAARAVLERARKDLRELTKQRDQLFESLADDD